MNARSPHCLAALFFALAALMFSGVPGHAASDAVHPGYRSLVTWLPGTDVRLDVGVWYPAARRPTTIKAGVWSFSAARNAPPRPGPWPLIVLSPDSSGSRFAHHDLAASLARKGFMVAVPTHDGDNADDMRFLFTDRQLPTRAHQLSATLDLVLDHPQLGPEADPRRIGLTGFGSGGTAGLLLAGAALTPDVWAGYCPPPAAAPGATPSSDAPDPYCAPYVAGKMNDVVQEMRTAADSRREAAARRDAAEEARAKAMRRAEEGIGKSHARVLRAQRKPALDVPRPPAFMPLLPPLPREWPLADARFRSMVLVSPGFSMLFDPASLRGLPVRLLLVGAERDILNRPEAQAQVLRRRIAPPAPDYASLPEADGPSFQALCPPDMAKDLPDLCASVTPDARQAVHAQLENLLLDFFRRTLN